MFKYSLEETVDVVGVHKIHVKIPVMTMMMTRTCLPSLFLDLQDLKVLQEMKDQMGPKDPTDPLELQVTPETTT